MKEDKKKEPDELEHYMIACSRLSRENTELKNQIAELDKPPEEVLLCDKEGLLTDKEIRKLKEPCEEGKGCPYMEPDCDFCSRKVGAKAQQTLDNQKRQKEIEGIFDVIDEHSNEPPFYPSAAEYDRNLTVFKESKWYKELKAKYGGKDA